MDIKVIRSEKEYEAALERVAGLMDAAPGSEEENELEVLSILVEKFENEHYPIDMPDPLSAIRFRMEQQGLTQKDLVPYIGSQPVVSAVLNGKRELSKEMIRNLHKGLGIPYEVLMQKPGAVYEKQAYFIQNYPFAEMVKQGYFPGFIDVKNARQNSEELLADLFSVFKNNQPEPVFCRHGNRQINQNALFAWQARAIKQIEGADLPDYDSKYLDHDFYNDLLHFSYYEKGVNLVREHLNKKGIHYVILNHLPGTYLDGASFIGPGGSPVIGMTLRHDRLDNFWFTLFHELGHLALHLAGSAGRVFFDDTELPDHDTCLPEEDEANRFAREKLIPQKAWWQDLTAVNKEAIVQKAEDFKLSPAIIAGQVRYEMNDYSLFSDLVGHKKVREQFAEYKVEA